MKTEEDQQQPATAGHRVPGPLLSALADGEATAAEMEQVAGQWVHSSALRAEWHAFQFIGDVMRSEELAHNPGRDEALLAAVRRRLADEPVVLAPVPSVPPSIQTLGETQVGLAASAASAPSARRSDLRARRRWMSSAAMVAGVATVAVALMVSRQGLPGSDGEPGAAPAGQLATLQAPAATPVPGAVPVQLTAVSGLHGVQAVAVPVAAPIGDPIAATAAASAPSGSRAAAGGVTAAAGTSAADAVGTGRVLRDEQLDRFLAAHRQFGAPAVPGQMLRSATSLAPAER